MMAFRYSLLPLAIMSFLLATSPSGMSRDNSTKTLRDEVINAATSRKKAEAYQALFEKVGRTGLPDLTKDEDHGIALHAAWEMHKKVVKRPKHIPLRTDDIYEAEELSKFLTFLKDRTKAPAPDWWGKSIQAVDVFPGTAHSFHKGNPGPTVRKSKAGFLVPEGAELKRENDTLRYTASGRTIEFPDKTFDLTFAEYFPGLVGDKRAFIASCSRDEGAGPFQLLAFEGGGGKPAWVADVWAARRGLSTGPSLHRVEVVASEKSVFVFGAESHGMYVEGFEAATGKCQFRFCSCYWFDFSETWSIK